MAGRFFLRFCLLFVAALAIAAIPQEKKTRRSCFGADQEKKFCKKPSGRYGRKIVKGEASSRPCMPQSECGTGHTGYRASLDSSPGGSQDTDGAFRSRVQRPGVRGCSHEQRSKTSLPQRTDLAQVKRDRHTGRPRNARSTKAFRLRQSNSFAEIRWKRLSLPTGEVHPSEHDYDYKEISLYDHKRHLQHPRYPVGQAGAA